MNGLVGAIASVRLHAEAALLRRLNAGAGFADPRIASQIYLRDEAALARLAGGTLRPQGTHRRAEAELAQVIAAAAGGDEPRDATRGGVNGPASPGQPPADGNISPPSIDPPPRLAILTERLAIDPVAS